MTPDAPPGPHARVSWPRVASVALDVAMILFAIPVVIRLTGLESGHPMVSLMAGFAYLAPLSAAGLAASLAVRNRRATTGFAVVHLVVLAVLLPQVVDGPGPASPPNGPTITVLGANLLHGQADADRIVELVDRYEVDVAALVEVTPDAVDRLSAAGLDDLLPLAHRRERPGTTGAAIYSAVPVEARPDVDPGATFAMLSASLDFAGARPVEVVAVHPQPPVTGGAAEQWEQALRALPRADLDVVRLLIGDFNATADHAAFRSVVQRGYVDAGDATGKGLVPTWSRLTAWPPLPPITLDHVLVDQRVAVDGFWVEDLPGSDHDVVVARLRLPAP